MVEAQPKHSSSGCGMTTISRWCARVMSLASLGGGRGRDHNERMPPARKGAAGREVSAGGVVFRHTAPGMEFALIKAGGRWSFPKGNIERGETPPVAALREISEETGLPLQHLRIIDQLPDVDYVF